jgi:hypothetical protein
MLWRTVISITSATGFQRGGIDPDPLALDQTGFSQHAPAPTQTLADAPPHRLAAVSARSWCGPVLLRSAESPRIPESTKSPPPAKRYPVPYLYLRSVLPAAAENRFREPTLAAPSRLPRNAGIGLPRICQNRVPPAVGSGVGKKGWPAGRAKLQVGIQSSSRRKLFSDLTPSGTCGRL